MSARKSPSVSAFADISAPSQIEEDIPDAPKAAAESVLDPDIIGPAQSWPPFSAPQTDVTSAPDPLLDDTFLLDDSLFTFGDTLTPNFGPVEWYDLLAEDAINSMQNQTQSSRWNFDKTTLSRRQSPRQSLVPEVGGAFGDPNAQAPPVVHKPWNSGSRIELKQDELVYFEYFIDVVAPILDLFDPGTHFARVVPHLALHNIGLLKSMLAVGACHMALFQIQPASELRSPMPPDTPASASSASPTTSRIAEQYYYETLQYLSQNLGYSDYTTSHEILATATMISTYEMYGTVSSSDHSNWDRHLRGAFWIQKTAGVSGESADGLHRAVWWTWYVLFVAIMKEMHWLILACM